MKIFYRISALSFALLTLVPVLDSAAAERSPKKDDPGVKRYIPTPDPEVPKFFSRWVNAKGDTFKANWPTKVEWVWKEDPKGKVPLVPVLRIWLQHAPDMKVVSGKGGGGEVVDLSPTISPFNKNVISIDTDRPSSAITLEFEKNQKKMKLGMVYWFVISKPVLVVHPFCNVNAVDILKRSVSGAFTFLGVYCEGFRNGDIDVYVSTSSDAVIERVKKEKVKAKTKDEKGGDKKKDEDEESSISFNFYEIPGEKIPHRIETLLIRSKKNGKTSKSELVFFGKKKKNMAERVNLRLGHGLSFASYAETLIPDLGSTAHFIEAAGSYPIRSRKWNVTAHSYFSLFPLAGGIGQYNMRFWGVNIRAGYDLPYLKPPWNLNVSFGVYYTTMFVTADVFGFRNMMGPQLFPVVSRKLDYRNTIIGYIKYSPVGTGFALTDFGNSEFAIGFAWNRLLDSGHTLYFSMGLTTMNLSLDTPELYPQILKTNISSTVFSFSGGFQY